MFLSLFLTQSYVSFDNNFCLAATSDKNIIYKLCKLIN